MDGFTQDEDTMHEPSVTNRLATSCAWFHELSTDALGSFPMRAVPISWIAKPGALSSIKVWISSAPAAASISAAAMDASFISAHSFSPYLQVIFSAGMPHA